MSHLTPTAHHVQRRPIQLTTQDDAVAVYQTIWDQTVDDDNVLGALTGLAGALGYRLDPLLQSVAELSLSELQKISRFAGNPNVPDSRKGNTAQHALQGTLVACYDLVDEFREFLLPPHMTQGRMWASYGDQDIDHIVKNVPNIIDSVFLEYLSHDDGEKLFEPASVSQTVASANFRKSWPVLERRIAHFGVALALYAHDTYADRGHRRAFYSKIFDEIRRPAREYYDMMRERLAAGQVDPAVYAEEVSYHIIQNFIKPQEARFKLSLLSTRYQNFMDRYLSRYDEPEGFGRAGGFTGIYTKIGQKNHSVMHIVEHHGFDGAAPHELTTSQLTVASLDYAESMLTRLFNEVEGGDPIHQRMATRAAIRIYDTNLAMTKMMPAVIDISKKRGEEAPGDSPDRLGEIRDLARQLCGDGGLAALHMHPARDISGPLRTSLQLQARYRAALDHVSEDACFTPPAAPLYKLNRVDGPIGNRIDTINLRDLRLFPGPDSRDLNGFMRRRWLGAGPQ